VVLTDRLRAAFKARSDLDGRDLVNSIFGSSGLASSQIEQGEREAMRSLLDGLYGVHRNRYAHADETVGWYEAEATLSMINWTLMWLQKSEARRRRPASPLCARCRSAVPQRAQFDYWRASVACPPVRALAAIARRRAGVRAAARACPPLLALSRFGLLVMLAST
jgi:hypothetical protein